MKTLKVFLAILTVALVLAPAASADSISLGPGACGGNVPQNDCGNFTITVTATTSTVSVTFSNGNASTWYLQYFSLNLYSGTVTATQNSVPAGQTITIHSGQGNNGLQQCNLTGPNSAFCVNVTSSGAISAGTSATYTFNISGGTLLNTADWHIQTTLTSTEDGKGDAVKLSTGPGLTEVPEPASMLLLGTGLLGAGRLVRRRTKK